MNLNSRLDRLERQNTDRTKTPEFVFYTTCDPNPTGEPGPGPSYPGMAVIVGSAFGVIHPHEGETEAEFRRRVYATKEGGKMVEDMTEEERAAAYAMADAKLAKETAQ